MSGKNDSGIAEWGGVYVYYSQMSGIERSFAFLWCDANQMW